MKTILTVIGTRPEAIKMAKLIELLNNDKSLNHKLCTTGQHKELLYQTLDVFNIKADIDLQVMTTNQTLADITAKIITGFTIATFNPSPIPLHTSISAKYLDLP